MEGNKFRRDFQLDTVVFKKSKWTGRGNGVGTEGEGTSCKKARLRGTDPITCVLDAKKKWGPGRKS